MNGTGDVVIELNELQNIHRSENPTTTNRAEYSVEIREDTVSARWCTLKMNSVYYYLVMLTLFAFLVADISIATICIDTIRNFVLESASDSRTIFIGELTQIEFEIVFFSTLLILRCVYWVVFLIKGFSVRKSVISFNNIIFDNRYKMIINKYHLILVAFSTTISILFTLISVIQNTLSLGEECTGTSIERNMCIVANLVVITIYVNIGIILILITYCVCNFIKKKIVKNKPSNHRVLVSDLIKDTEANTNQLTDVCPVCLDTSEPEYASRRHTGVVTLPCSHKFHKICINKWFESVNTCPTCRVVIVSDEVRQLYLQLV